MVCVYLTIISIYELILRHSMSLIARGRFEGPDAIDIDFLLNAG